MINLAFASGDAMKNEREKVLFETVKGFKHDVSSEMEWTKLRESARTASLARLHEILGQVAGRRAGSPVARRPSSTGEPSLNTGPALQAPPSSI